MSGDDTYKVEEFTRLVHNERVVVLQAGQTIPQTLAVKYGLVKGTNAKKKASDKDS